MLGTIQTWLDHSNGEHHVGAQVHSTECQGTVQQCAPGMIACRDMYSDILQALAMSNIYSHVTELLQCLWNKDQTHQTY